MKNSQAIVKLLTVGVFVSSIILSPFVLDFTLLTRFISITLFIAAAFYFLYKSGLSFTLKLDLILFFYLLYAMFCCFTIFWAKNKAEAFFATSKIVLAFFVFLLSYFSLKTHGDLFLDRLRKFSVLIFYLLFICACVEYSLVKVVSKDWLYLITGLNGHKNLYASFLFLNLFFLISASLRTSGNWRLFARLGVVITVCLIVFLKTKAVWVGIFASFCVYGIFQFYKPGGIFVRTKWYVSVITCLIIVNVFFVFILHPLVRGGISRATTQHTSMFVDEERLVLWDKTYYMVQNNKLFGVGVGNWQVYFPDASLRGLWRAEDLNYTFQRPHNDFLWVLSETGIVGFNLFMVFLILLLSRFVGTLKFISLPDITEASLCLACLIGYYVVSFFDFPMERVEHLIWVNVLLAFAYYYVRRHNPMTNVLNISVSRPVFVLSGLGLGFIFSLGLMRYLAELGVRKMYDAKTAGNAAGVIVAGQSASNLFYTLDPTSVPINWYIGNANVALGNYKTAHHNFLKAHSFNPYNRNVLNDLASSYSLQNKQDSAKFFYKEASRISPRFDEPKLNLAAVYMGEGNYRKASEVLDSLFHNSERRTKYSRMVDVMKNK